MAKEPALPSNRDPHGKSLFLWGFQRDLAPQASLQGSQPPLRPHPKPSQGHKAIRLVAPGQKASSRGW